MPPNFKTCSLSSWRKQPIRDFYFILPPLLLPSRQILSKRGLFSENGVTRRTGFKRRFSKQVFLGFKSQAQVLDLNSSKIVLRTLPWKLQECILEILERPRLFEIKWSGYEDEILKQGLVWRNSYWEGLRKQKYASEISVWSFPGQSQKKFHCWPWIFLKRTFITYILTTKKWWRPTFPLLQICVIIRQ